MSFRLLVRPEVDDDLQIAEEWYEQQRTGLGQEYLRDVISTVQSA